MKNGHMQTYVPVFFPMFLFPSAMSENKTPGDLPKIYRTWPFGSMIDLQQQQQQQQDR